MPDFDAFVAEVQEWQRETFPGGTAVGAAKHLVEEAGELLRELRWFEGEEDRPYIAEEAADVLLLLIAVAGMANFDLMAAARDKMVKNRARTWETEPGEKGYRKHIESTGQ